MKNPIRFFCGVFAILGLILCIAAALRLNAGFPSGVYPRDLAVYKLWINWGTLLWFMMAPISAFSDFFHKGE